MALRRVTNYIRGFVQEWKEFNRVYQPMPDPPGTTPAAVDQAVAQTKKLTLKQYDHWLFVLFCNKACLLLTAFIHWRLVVCCLVVCLLFCGGFGC